MKYLKLFEEYYNKKIGNTYKDDDWMVMELENQEQFNMIRNILIIQKDGEIIT